MLPDFFKPFQDRKIDRIAAAYAVGAWLAVQAASIALPTFEAPAWIMKALIVIAILGFPATIAIAWAATPHAPSARTAYTRRETVLFSLLAVVITVAAAQFIFGLVAAPRVPAPPLAAHRIRSIAVLPLDNYSGDAAQEFFADGMTDELTTALARISKLRVISRSSAMGFKGAHRPSTPQIAKLLNVDAVVEGSVIRSGNRVRITAQLIDAAADRHLWAKTFERDSRDVFALQDELTTAIANEINVQLTPREKVQLRRARAIDPDAHDAYLKGRYFFARPSDENLKKAIAQFQQAIRLDPTFAPAYSGLSDASLWAGYNEGFMTALEGRTMSKAAAEKAIALDDDSAEGHASLATFLLFYGYDWKGCEREYRRSIALNPNYSFSHDQFGLSLAFTGRFSESYEQGKLAEALDPLSPQIVIDTLFAYVWQGKIAEAHAQMQKATALDPTFFFPPWGDGWIDIETGHPKDAIAPLQKAAAMDAPGFVTAWLGYAYGAAGDSKAALATIAEMQKHAIAGKVPGFSLALVYLGLGDKSRALDNLEKAYAENSQWIPWLKLDKVFDPLRGEPRFIALLKKANFLN